MSDFINGILLLYYHPLRRVASTVMEHVEAFERHSQFKVLSLNTELGFPKNLSRFQFKVIVLHYSLFGITPYQLNAGFLNYLKQSKSYKIAFFQDEHHFCQSRFAFLNRYQVDCVYTLLEPEYFKDVYQKYTSVPKLVYGIPGYVPENLIALAKRITKPDKERKIDIGYRGRILKFYMGKGGQEKSEIGRSFLKQAHSFDLKIDISVVESKRIYGESWYEFLSNCRAVLGAEAGVSIFDLEDVVRLEYERLIKKNPKITFEEMSENILSKWEDNIPYRTISPRHFEAAALRVCQILFEGKYSGIMKPMVHYIPLQKDFSNFDEVIRMFRDERLRHELQENAYRDLIASDRFSYRHFIKDFDRELGALDLSRNIDKNTIEQTTELLNQDLFTRRIKSQIRSLFHTPFPGRRFIVSLVKPAIARF